MTRCNRGLQGVTREGQEVTNLFGQGVTNFVGYKRLQGCLQGVQKGLFAT